MEKLSSVKIPIAFNLDQEKIANFLDEKTSQFDSIISKKEKLIERLEEAKKSLISEVVTGKVKVVKTDDGYELIKRSSEEMKDSGVEWLGEIPKEWDIKRLRFLGKLQNGISKSSDSFGYGYPFVSYSNVYRNIELPHIVEGL
ncbi:restriction endonuclease subunit S, partial [Clostridioides difficile]|nr:restriction endonuclease subunit S [Clostridioides difficile]